jgi:hypothetical protein
MITEDLIKALLLAISRKLMTTEQAKQYLAVMFGIKAEDTK